MKDVELGEVRGIRVAVVCPHCKGERRLPGGPYRKYGEVVDCPICNGMGTVGGLVTVAQLRQLLLGEEA